MDFESYSNLQSLADFSKVAGHEISDLSALMLQADVALVRKGKGYGYGYGYGGHKWKGRERKYGHLFNELFFVDVRLLNRRRAHVKRISRSSGKLGRPRTVDIKGRNDTNDDD